MANRGYIEKRGDTFRISVEMAPVRGRRKRLNRTVHTTSVKVAWKELTKLLREANKSPKVKPDTAVTVADWVNIWLDERFNDRINPLKPYTKKSYAQFMRGIIVPNLGHIKLVELTLKDIKDLYNDLMNDAIPGTQVSEVTVRHLHRIFASALKYAESEGKILRSPHRGVKWPKPQKQGMVISDEAQLNALLSYARSMEGTDNLKGLVYAAMYTGLWTGARLGEIMALRWQDINFERLTLAINNNLVWVDGQFHLLSPKNGESRTIDISSDLSELLEERYFEQVEQFKVFGKNKDGSCVMEVTKDTPVFTIQGQGWVIPPSIGMRFGKLVRKVMEEEPQLDWPKGISFHTLRHTHASYLIGEPGAGISTLMAVSKRLGHKDIRVTMEIYAHLLKDSESLSDRFQEIMKRILGDGLGDGSIKKEWQAKH